MEIHWTEHLAAIHAFHAKVSVRYADRLIDRITARTKQLANFPRSGAVIPEAENLQIRQLLEGDYRILYVVTMDRVDVLGVLHGARASL